MKYNQRGSRGRGGFSHRRGKPGPKLPAALASEVDTGKDRSHGRPRGGGRGRGGFRPRDDRNEPPKRERDPPAKRERSQLPIEEDVSEEEAPPAKRKKLPELKLPKSSRVGDAEDGEIEWLEYMLRKEKKAEDGLEDGLDDLLDFADIIGPGGKGLNQDESGDEEDEEEEEEEGSDFDLSGSDIDDSGEDDEPESDGDGDEDESDEDEASAEEGDGDEDEDTDGEDKDRKEDIGTEATPAPIAETAPTKYIPPSLRAAQLAEKSKGDASKVAEKLKLDRKVQGLLNKIGESNMDIMLGEIENLYRDHSRHDVTTTLTDSIITMISDRANLLDSFVVLYATIVGTLHRIIGIEFGAHFTHTLVMRYHNLATGIVKSSVPTSTIYETADESKEGMNLLTLIAELFNAQVISAKLIYDLIRGFLEAPAPDGQVMGEIEVERLLKVLRCSGPQLRHEDPASLKDIVNLVQEKTKGKEKTMTARARFMIETLNNLKSGQGKAQSSDGQAAERMRKFLSGLGRKRRVLTTEPLRISLSDLLTADSRGKWWLVGAGWSGNPLVDRQEQKAKEKPKKVKQPALEQEEQLLEVAKKQGMNTDIRRSIFVVLMTSEDYAHACDRMSQFKLSETQQRECVRVTLHCVGSEQIYNPYYTLVLHHLCAMSYSHRFTLQYALWDFLRNIDGEEKQPKHKIEHTAKALAYIVARGTMDLTIFKGIDFTSLRSPSLSFLTTFLRCLILGTQTASPLFTLPKSYSIAKLDPETIDEAFEKSLSNSEVAQGLTYVLEKVKSKMMREQDEEVVVETIRKGMKRARAVLGRAI